MSGAVKKLPNSEIQYGNICFRQQENFNAFDMTTFFNICTYFPVLVSTVVLSVLVFFSVRTDSVLVLVDDVLAARGLETGDWCGNNANIGGWDYILSNKMCKEGAEFFGWKVKNHQARAN